MEDIDYIEEDKAVWLTPKGVKFAESFFGISNFSGRNLRDKTGMSCFFVVSTYSF